MNEEPSQGDCGEVGNEFILATSASVIRRLHMREHGGLSRKWTLDSYHVR